MVVDVRARYTKMVIQKSLIDLLKEKPLSKITVKEICDLAQINRSTFYKHYMDVFDLFEKIEAGLLEDLHELMRELKQIGIKQTFIKVLEGLKKNDEVYKTLFGLNDNNFNTKLAMDFFSELITFIDYENLNLSAEKQNWIFIFTVCGTSGIMHSWLKNGMKESPEQVADFIENLINYIMEAIKTSA